MDGDRDQPAAAVGALAQRRGSSARVALPAEARLDAQGHRGVRVRRRRRAVLHSQAGQAAQSADRGGAQLRRRHARRPKSTEDGPIDLRRAIRSFNAMQRQVADEMARRTGTLAAISHDVRTPLTALRVKAEMVDDRRRARRSDREHREDGADHGLGAGVPERRIARRADATRRSERAAGKRVRGVRGAGTATLPSSASMAVQHTCRPDALARAVRNLIDNAVKYGGSARVALRPALAASTSSLPTTARAFPRTSCSSRLSRSSGCRRRATAISGGFGLGLAIARAIAEGHEGQLILAKNEPSGLMATIRLPAGRLT